MYLCEIENIASNYFSQLQQSVHFQRVFLLAHLPLHSLWLLHLHFTSSLHAFEAIGFMFHTETHDLLFS